MGLSLKHVEAAVFDQGRELYREFGELLFTHFGVSGPLILSASSYYVKKCNDMPVRLCIDLKPALTGEQLDKRLLRDFDENKNRQFKNALGNLFPAKLIPVMTELSGIAAEKKVNEITRQERRGFAERIQPHQPAAPLLRSPERYQHRPKLCHRMSCSAGEIIPVPRGTRGGIRNSAR